MRRRLAVAALAVLATAAQAQPETVAVHAAGSLRTAMTDLARAFERDGGAKVALTFGASGLLKDRIEGGEAANVFASANMSHPEALQAAGKAESVQPFARNALCLLAQPAFDLKGRSLAQRLLDADVRVATSTPRADPAGDYAFQMFDRIEGSGAAGPGSAAALKAKALQLAGGPNSPQPPAGRGLYGVLMAEGRADVFVTYCTNATQARQEVAGLQVLEIPAAINVAATYGIATVRPASAGALRFVDFVLGAQGRQVLRGHGFSAP